MIYPMHNLATPELKVITTQELVKTFIQRFVASTRRFGNIFRLNTSLSICKGSLQYY